MLLAAVLIPALASGQELRDLALAWVQGDYRAPLVCVLDGTARQALRRVRIHPGRPSDRPSVRLGFHDLEAPSGISCSGVSGEPEPNVVGVLELVFEGRSRPDTGEVDFRNALRREGGFTFRVMAGHLRIGAAGASTAALEDVDFSGGSAQIRSVPPGSDAARRLSLFGAERQRELKLSAASGKELTFELVELPRSLTEDGRLSTGAEARRPQGVATEA
jgi:hypothetical protein